MMYAFDVALIDGWVIDKTAFTSGLSAKQINNESFNIYGVLYSLCYTDASFIG